MKTIWKYPIPDIKDGEVGVAMPDGAVVVHADQQRGRLCLWALADPARPAVQRRFLIAGTGVELPDAGLRHVATVLMMADLIVLHVFEVIGP